MNVHTALDFIDKLVYEKTRKHLNDLEREVFVGSWQGKTYEEIYPLNSQYLEKDVGYKLWKKLSDILGEKVTKKKIRGAVDRAWKQQRSASKQVFVSHQDCQLERELARSLKDAIAAAGYEVRSSQENGDTNWIDGIDTKLKQCDILLLLLSPETATSEMVIEQLKRAKFLQAARTSDRPAILTVRIGDTSKMPFNHDLRGYLEGTVALGWSGDPDTSELVKNVLEFLAGNAIASGSSPVVETEDSLRLLNSQFIVPNSPPLPVAEPELPAGQVRLASAFYIDRPPNESLCYQEIVNPGSLIRIKAPRQMGKTSLMARVLDRAKEKGYRTVPLSFQHADNATFSSLDRLLQWFCAKISRKLRLSHAIEDYWSEMFGSKDNCTAYFEDCLLAEDTPLVLGLDEVDRVFQYPKIADDFFGLLRAWYEEAGYGDGNSELWEKLRLVVVHSTEVYVPMDINQSPFNVGLPVELPEFNGEQVLELTRRHGLDWNSDRVSLLMDLVGGHPYLIRLALYRISQQQLTLDNLLKTAHTEAGLYGDHLRRHLWNLQQHPELETAFAKVVSNLDAVELESSLAFKLHGMGLVRLQGDRVSSRFELYRQYFGDRVRNP